MKISNLLASFSKKILILILFLIAVFALLYYLWQRNKIAIVKNKIENILTTRTDSLYSIKYDSLYFDELTGDAFLRNIRITADSVRIKNMDPKDQPYLFLDITIKSISIKGVKTDKALGGHEMIGDTVVIDEPQVLVYYLKKIKKETKIDAEAKEIYQQILGRLDRIKVGQVLVNNARVHAISFLNHYRQFDLVNTNINLEDVRIDSLNNEDTSRILFCRNASFTVSHFTSFNNNREEMSVKDVRFSGKEKLISFSKFSLKRFDDKTASGVNFIESDNMIISGVNTYEIVKNKNIFIDSIRCNHILFYRPPGLAANEKAVVKTPVDIGDTAGFRAAYSLQLNNLYFPDITIVENKARASKNNYTLGQFSVKVREVKADRILDIQDDPVAHTKEFDLYCDHITSVSDDRLYRYYLGKIGFNSLKKQLSVGSFKVTPTLGELAFAKKQTSQKDRYDMSLSGITVNGTNLDRILEKQVIASAVNVAGCSIKIYRDISRPLDGVSKVGKYPHQILQKADIPIDIAHVTLNNTYLEYKEKNALTGRTGTIPFSRGRIVLDNVTNIKSSTKRNGISNASFETTVLGALPLNIRFKFFLLSTDGKFAVDGTMGSCNATKLNQVSIPMALMKIDTGFIDNANFQFTGNDKGTDGEFVMRYHEMKINMLKKDKDSGFVKKRTLLSFLANTMIKNDNPHNGKLRTFTVHYDRDSSKSFFNLAWKTIFTGIQATMGKPMPKIKEK